MERRGVWVAHLGSTNPVGCIGKGEKEASNSVVELCKIEFIRIIGWSLTLKTNKNSMDYKTIDQSGV